MFDLYLLSFCLTSQKPQVFKVGGLWPGWATSVIYSTQLSGFGLTPALEKKLWCTSFAALPGLSQLPWILCLGGLEWTGCQAQRGLILNSVYCPGNSLLKIIEALWSDPFWEKMETSWLLFPFPCTSNEIWYLVHYSSLWLVLPCSSATVDILYVSYKHVLSDTWLAFLSSFIGNHTCSLASKWG